MSDTKPSVTSHKTFRHERPDSPVITTPCPHCGAVWMPSRRMYACGAYGPHGPQSPSRGNRHVEA